MKRWTYLACTLGGAVTVASCSPDQATSPVSGLTPSFAKGGNIDTDSRAVLVWEDFIVVNSMTTIPAGIRGDDYDRYSDLTGADEYQGQVCGVHAKIFNTPALSNSGDLVFDPDFDAPGKSCNGVSRKLHFYLDGPTGPATAIGTFTNTRQVWQMTPGTTKEQPQRFIFVNQPGCESLAFDAAFGGDNVLVTRVSHTEWRVESTGDHLAACLVSSKGKTVANGMKLLPFAYTVTEVPHPYEIKP